MKIIHFCAGLQFWNGMANTARQFIAEEIAQGHESFLTNELVVLSRAKSGAYDIVYIHGAWLPVLWRAAKHAKRIDAKLIIRPAGSYDPMRLGYHSWKKRLVAFFERRMLRRADWIVATCEAEKGWIEAYEPGVKKIEIVDIKRFFKFNRVERVDRVEWIAGEGDFMNRVDRVEGIAGEGDFMNRVERVDRVEGVAGEGDFMNRVERVDRVEGGAEKDELHLLYLGRRHPLKGVEFLEAAVRQLQNSTRSTRSTRLNIELRIVSNAKGEELEMVWEWCDVLVLPTLSENFGRVVAEALERGKRVITTDGAPAWGEGLIRVERVDRVEGEFGIGFDGRLIYLKGYRDGSDEKRVELLKRAISTL